MKPRDLTAETERLEQITVESITKRTAKKVRKLAKQQEEGEGNEVH
jgi:hypothetical protein